MQALGNVASKFTFITEVQETEEMNESPIKNQFQLNFGVTEFIVSPDFKTIRSDFSNSYYYALNGDLMLREFAPRSII